jgi:hypothetical protein
LDPVEYRGVTYHGSIAWRDDCKGEALDPMRPLKGHYCQSLLFGNFDFEWCEKGESYDTDGNPSWGLSYGGYTNIGCLTYRSWRSGGGDKIKFKT